MSNFLSTFFDFGQMAKVFPNLFAVGLRNTLELAVGAILVGLVLATPLSLMSISRRVWVRFPARAYIDLFRGLPTIVTIFLVGEGLPLSGVHFLGAGSYPYGILALGLIATAYISEIFRSGIESIEKGQMMAARSLGMPYMKAMRLIIVPQGIRRILPALTNQLINTIKDSSLVFFLGFTISQQELYRIAQSQAQATGNLSPLVAAGVVYLIITVPLTHLVNVLDQRLRQGRAQVDTPVEDDLAPVAAPTATGGAA